MPEEQTILKRSNDGFSEHSRLACCIAMRPQLNEMVISIGFNRPEVEDPLDSFNV